MIFRCREGSSDKHLPGEEGMFPQNRNIPSPQLQAVVMEDGACGGGLQTGDSVLRFFADPVVS